jgi:predicted  nucleic acid-binding Zn-ribbon protein
MTEEEQAQAQAAANQPPQPDAAMIIAEAERTKGEADVINAQTKAAETQAKLALEAQKIEIQRMQNDLKFNEQRLKIMDMQQKAGMAVDLQEFNMMVKRIDMANQALNDATDRMNKDADTLHKLKEATGADAIIDPAVGATYHGLATDMAQEVT